MALKKLIAACKLEDMHVGIVWEGWLRKASGFYTIEILNLKAIKDFKVRNPVLFPSKVNGQYSKVYKRRNQNFQE